MMSVSLPASLCAIVLCLAAGCGWPGSAPAGNSSSAATDAAGASASREASSAPSSPSTPAAPSTPATAQDRARALVDAMSLEERVGQLVMAPLFAGSDASSLAPAIRDRHVGSVLVIGKWTGGVDAVAKETAALQAYAPEGDGLIVATDQEGGSVQHLTGEGFDAMPSGVKQGAMDAAALRSSAARWGSQLKEAGVNVDLAPVTDTVRGARKSNAPIGALNRDFGLDADGNAEHAIAFVNGMRDSGVMGAVKHYPGLGAVTGNTDFTADGIEDSTTTLDGPEVAAFDRTIREGRPAMVMMALATYRAVDASAPAAFSSAIIDGHLRGTLGYQGVVISDSLSAEALGGVPTDQLGVRLIEAGGDLACIGNSSYVTPILDGLVAKAKADPAFAERVAESAARVMALKIEMGLAD
ncbi:beta-glucosidase [Bifidobacterium avesanii]|uniref:Beta-glucosidase n=2 Tax=Bifidobacterium avesanii TaxID=1798157 RepID=A0A7K3TI41_9BIFI|nr:beta-glucosidase [Bifidobacterium avesanii]NEG78379.1 beta-glucosidase [Bifidobacterium avesanii]